VSTTKRSSVLPNVPTIAESGLPGFDYNLWSVRSRPPTAAEIVDKIARDVARALTTPEVGERPTALGAGGDADDACRIHPVGGTEMDDPAAIKAANIKVQ
jgi:tripartite-type tricarboxylate transporter receptor subunit TctC